MLMKLLSWVIMVIVMLPANLASQQETPQPGSEEVTGIIKEVSVNVRRVTLETAQRQEKTVSVERETRIIVNRQAAAIEDLKPGQSIRVVLPRDSSKAILIEVT